MESRVLAWRCARRPPDDAEATIAREVVGEHFAGADERAAAAYEFIEPRGWEFYGKPSEVAMEGMRASVERFGVPLTVEPEFNGGFLRLQPA